LAAVLGCARRSLADPARAVDASAVRSYIAINAAPIGPGIAVAQRSPKELIGYRFQIA